MWLLPLVKVKDYHFLRMSFKEKKKEKKRKEKRKGRHLFYLYQETEEQHAMP